MCVHVYIRTCVHACTCVYACMCTMTCSLQCSPIEFYCLVRTLSQVSDQMASFSEMSLKDIKSELLLRIIRKVSTSCQHVSVYRYVCMYVVQVPVLLDDLQDTMNNLNEQAARLTDSS